MGSFEIEGGHSLKGELIPQGAKNEALQIISAVLLTPEEVVIENIPNIRDVNKLMHVCRTCTTRSRHVMCLAQFPVSGFPVPEYPDLLLLESLKTRISNGSLRLRILKFRRTNNVFTRVQ